MAALAAVNAAPSAPVSAAPAAPAVGPTEAAIAAAEAAAAVAAAAAKKADKAKKDDSDSDETSMSDAEMLPEVELASLGDDAAAAGQPGLPCGVLPVVDAPVVTEVPPPVAVPVGDSGFALSPVLLGLLGLGALGLGYLLLKDDDDDDDDIVDEPNEPPVAADDAVSVNEDATVTGSVATNDVDPDGDEADLTYALNGAAPAGLTFNNDGSFTFNAADAAYQDLGAGETETVTVQYTVTDPDGGTDTATLTITINGVNDAPVAADDTAAATEDGPVVTGTVAANDSDPDGDALTYTLDAPVAGLTLNADGTYSFDPSNAAYQELAAGETQTVVANYTVSDGNGGTDTATLTITVTGANDAPDITSGTTASVDENVPAGTEVYDANAVDPDGDTLTYTLGGPDAAAFTIDPATGEVFIVDSPDFETQPVYNITVTATDPSGASDTQAVTITVNDLPENEPPVLIAPATADVDENAPGAVVLDADATDPDGDPVTFSLEGPDAAFFTIDPDTGVVTINQGADFETRQTYNITVVATDPDGARDSQDVVVSVNDMPEPVVMSLDRDNDNNTLTPFTIDAGDEWYQFVDDDDIANNVVLTNFGAEDYIVFDAPFSGVGAVAFAAQDTGDGDGLNDLLITVNNGGTLTQIRIEDVADPGVFVYDEATAEAAVAGTDTFRTTAGAPGTTSLDVDSDNDPMTAEAFDASGGDVAFVDDSAIANNATVTGIGAGDTFTLNTTADQVSFSSMGGDLIVTTNEGGVVSQVVFEDAVATDAVVTDEPSAETALGFDFFQFA